MPPKAKISKELILDAAFDIARTEGLEQINARRISRKLGCSTQPVMYYYGAIEDIKRAVYEKADWFHSAYLMNVNPESEDPMLDIGRNYIRFAIEEPHLFRLLFQSGYAAEHNVLEMINSEELKPILAIMVEESGMQEERVKEVFLTIALFAHGYASILANNSLEYDEALVSGHLERAYRGAVLALREDEK